MSKWIKVKYELFSNQFDSIHKIKRSFEQRLNKIEKEFILKSENKEYQEYLKQNENANENEDENENQNENDDLECSLN